MLNVIDCFNLGPKHAELPISLFC